MKNPKTENKPQILFFPSSAEWEKFLKENHQKYEGVWVKFAKKASGIKSVTYDEALLVALTWGWIDGLVNSLDENYYLQKFTPRRKRSNWSVRNIGIVENLIKEGKMKPPGILEVERAKKDGRFTKQSP